MIQKNLICYLWTTLYNLDASVVLASNTFSTWRVAFGDAEKFGGRYKHPCIYVLKPLSEVFRQFVVLRISCFWLENNYLTHFL